MTLTSTSDLPLRSHEPFRQWHGEVTPVVFGQRPVSWDFHVSSGAVPDLDDLSVGFDSRHLPLVARALGSQGGAFAEQDGRRLLAFGYAGDHFPVTARFYFSPEEQPWPEGWVVYSHYEERWGRDLSWSRAFPVHVDAAP